MGACGNDGVTVEKVDVAEVDGRALLLGAGLGVSAGAENWGGRRWRCGGSSGHGVLCALARDEGRWRGCRGR